jgi:hypothetical protein
MTVRLLPAVFFSLLLPYCSNGEIASRGSPPPRRTAGEPRELAGITAAHNAVRARVGVAPLVWDEELAATAEAWVRRCVDRESPRGVLDHNPDRSEGHRFYVGENLAAGTAPLVAAEVVKGWASESDHYDYRRNRCARGRNCGHYTQIVWAATERVGCAAGSCRRHDFPYVVVCDYGPGGNSGGRPY